MSRDIGEALDEQLIAHLRGGAPILLTWARDSKPVCVFGRGLAAAEDAVEVEVFGAVGADAVVALHTLGPPVCMIRGRAQVEAAADEATWHVRVQVEHVKDDRPPGLGIRPLTFLDEGEGS